MYDIKGFLEDPYQNFIHTSRYARWLEDKGRRETFVETTERYLSYMVNSLKKNHNYDVPQDHLDLVREQMLNQGVVSSMRALMTAGPALDRDNVAAYNCSYVPIDDVRAFDETLYILMNGTGVGFSVEEKYVRKLPVIAEEFEATESVIKVADSKEGWARAYRELLSLLWGGRVPRWDTSKVRPAGARLKTFGGRASGPGPLEQLFQFTIDVFTKAAGRQLTSLEAHDLVCKIAEVVVVGGVRRSALISLSDLSDLRMATAKAGNWWENNPQRALANNSVAYTSKPDMTAFMSEWKNLYDSKSGERGIFNRQAAKSQVAKNQRRETDFDFGTNPCSEIILRPNQFCNLTEVIIRPDDTVETLMLKVKAATIIGTWQSTLTNFKYLRKIWKKNTEEERLLGVSLTGQFGNRLMSGQEGIKELKDTLEALRYKAIATNAEVAEAIGIPQSAAITCVKPSGTVSQRAGVPSGMHTEHDEFYIRTVRGDNKDALTQFLKDSGIPNEPDVMKPNDTTVFSFPKKAAPGALTRNDLTAIEHLEIWLAYQRSWCEHKPSITVSVKEHEWMEVGAWVYKNFDEVSGISFLPFSEHTYKQAPYQSISEAEYKEWLERMPEKIEWDLLPTYEFEDNTTGSQELACSAAGGCEVVDIS
ncbi:ribonucleotide reductase [Streptomyces phage Spilled]|uniref:Ribonucleotide reductase n=3 Tax=Streptomyces virus Karimac TaxID=2846401 RepID=A0A890V3Q1_9CAUD|nr:ribonucleoside-triphosphate reductase [Streptomyces sp. JV178]YP_009840216.1 ribonucleotide reductase [Streptomyces phage Karimac]AXH66552.1 ribonucleotide reductase [Streptomyces phage Starbow]QDF17218.1 ribonucleotide reductase [Streptomyces phage Birchlyn]QFP97358.1 ribonucleotide reductase [Streptomyces phage IchabodCrane]QGH78930.1 ribonucleotide reductase [Streptomyces phage TomSawyer]QRI45731.1 ribonucleotide reductase [Streptomyces phage Battuta]UVK59945.1 ribonucleotide reductase